MQFLNGRAKVLVWFPKEEEFIGSGTESHAQLSSGRPHYEEPITLADSFEQHDKARRIRGCEEREPCAWKW